MILNEMIRSLPLYERKSKVFREIFNAEAKQFKLMDEQLEDIRRQLIIDTATWGLKIYEKELRIVVPTNSSLETRRAVIKAKWQSDGKVDRALLESVASTILQTIVKVEFNGEIKFNFNSKDNKKPILDYSLFENTINEIKPAHLGMSINISNQLDMNLYSGGIISTRNKIQIRPAAFNMPTIHQTKYYAGFISTRSITTIKLEV